MTEQQKEGMITKIIDSTLRLKAILTIFDLNPIKSITLSEKTYYEIESLFRQIISYHIDSKHKDKIYLCGIELIKEKVRNEP